MPEKIDISEHIADFTACPLDKYTDISNFKSEYGMYTDFINPSSNSGASLAFRV